MLEFRSELSRGGNRFVFKCSAPNGEVELHMSYSEHERHKVTTVGSEGC